MIDRPQAPDGSDFSDKEYACFWCGRPTRSGSWACLDCRPLKEMAYAEARGKGLSAYNDVIALVLDTLEAAGRI